LDEKFKKQRTKIVRELAEKADPFIKRRLLDLAARYESDYRATPQPTPIDLQFPNQGDDPEDNKSWRKRGAGNVSLMTQSICRTGNGSSRFAMPPIAYRLS
jgi:hypothetical protein